jgi:hypothetical protein
LEITMTESIEQFIESLKGFVVLTEKEISTDDYRNYNREIDVLGEILETLKDASVRLERVHAERENVIRVASEMVFHGHEVFYENGEKATEGEIQDLLRFEMKPENHDKVWPGLESMGGAA